MIDLSKRGGKNASSKFARILIKELGSKVKIRKNTHRFASFAVLKNANMASVLVELGFISNRHDAKKLRSSAYRNLILAGTVDAVDKYFSDV